MSKPRNYDIDKLTFWIAEPGFIIGEGIIGVNRIGGDQAAVQIDPDFYSMTIDSPVTVDGVFVHREVRRLTLKAKETTPITYEGKRIIVKYDDIELFHGTVRDYDIQESWTTRAKVIGIGTVAERATYKDYDVTITAMSGEERFANTPSPHKNFNGEELVDRIQSYLGTANAGWDSEGASDINIGLATNVVAASTGHLVYASDSMPNLLESMRNEMRLLNYHIIYEPWDSSFYLRTNSRWVGKDAVDEDTALHLTPDPEDLVISGGDDFVHNSNVVGYKPRGLTNNSAYFVKGVTITMTNNLDVTTTYGPYRASSAFPEDIDINIGRQSDAGQALADKIAATLPLRSMSQQYTYSIRTELQSRQQLGINGEGPGMAVLMSDIFHLANRRIAILSVAHTVTRDLWTVDYTCGPEHLISRESDKQPFIVTDFGITETVPGTQWKFSWTTPDLNSNVPLYAIIYSGGPDGTDPGEVYRGAAKTPGFGEEIFISGLADGFWEFYVYYTNNPTPDSTATGYIYSPRSVTESLLIL